MDRAATLAALSDRTHIFDVVIIGGGATGAGIALDAASRGFRTALIERDDFGSGASSKSTKLIHGGVRYLANGHLGLVREALHERSLLLKNAAHLVEPQSFVIPLRGWLEKIKYSAGLGLYDWLASGDNLPRSERLSKRATAAALPALVGGTIDGGIRYWDAKFDDARLLWSIVESAIGRGALALNHCTAVAFDRDHGRLRGVIIRDNETDQTSRVAARVVVNAAGPHSGEVSSFDDPAIQNGLAPSQGSHIVLDMKFHQSRDAMLVPKTADGRVMFVIPWNGRALVGTTDVPVAVDANEPAPLPGEIDLILNTMEDYLIEPPRREDVLSCFAGIRPLSLERPGMETSKISREHRIDRSPSGLITITGGKWTTYRKMAQDCVDMINEYLPRKDNPCVTEAIDLAADVPASQATNETRFSAYGRHAAALTQLIEDDPDLNQPLARNLPYTKAEALWAVRSEMARTVADVLARRTRVLFLDAREAVAIAPEVAATIARELGYDDSWVKAESERFAAYAAAYLV